MPRIPRRRGTNKGNDGSLPPPLSCVLHKNEENGVRTTEYNEISKQAEEGTQNNRRITRSLAALLRKQQKSPPRHETQKNEPYVSPPRASSTSLAGANNTPSTECSTTSVKSCHTKVHTASQVNAEGVYTPSKPATLDVSVVDAEQEKPTEANKSFTNDISSCKEYVLSQRQDMPRLASKNSAKNKKTSTLKQTRLPFFFGVEPSSAIQNGTMKLNPEISSTTLFQSDPPHESSNKPNTTSPRCFSSKKVGLTVGGNSNTCSPLQNSKENNASSKKKAGIKKRSPRKKWQDNTLEEDLSLIKSISKMKGRSVTEEDRPTPPEVPCSRLTTLFPRSKDEHSFGLEKDNRRKENNHNGLTNTPLTSMASKATIRNQPIYVQQEINLEEPRPWSEEIPTQTELEASYGLKIPPTYNEILRHFTILEQVIVQRWRDGEPMLFNVPSVSGGGMSLRDHTEQLGGRRVTLSHVRQMAWVAPHLISLSWVAVRRGVPLQVDELCTPGRRHAWDLQVEQRHFSSRGAVVLGPLKPSEMDLRIKSFRFSLIQFLLQQHNAFLKSLDPPLCPIPLEHLSQWHRQFDFEQHVADIPEARLPPRAHCVQVTTPVRSCSLRSTTPISMPCTRSCADSPNTPRHSLSLSCLADVTPLRLGTSPTPLPGRYVYAHPITESCSTSTPVRVPTKSTTHVFTPVRYVSPMNNLGHIPPANEKVPTSAVDKNETTPPAHVRRTPLRSRTPPRVAQESRTPPKSKVLLMQKAHEERERHDFEMLSKKTFESIQHYVRDAEDTLLCMEALVRLFAGAHTLPLAELNSVVSKLTVTLQCTHPGMTQERVKEAIQRVEQKTTGLITIRQSKCSKTQKLIQFHKTADFEKEKKKLIADVLDAQKTTEELQSEKLKELRDIKTVETPVSSTHLSPFPLS